MCKAHRSPNRLFTHVWWCPINLFVWCFVSQTAHGCTILYVGHVHESFRPPSVCHIGVF
ncbi:hypothetical protein PF005_g24679 [Phytophthora fragariae]|uniref:Uncharacterized protein n=1 Tax=Phytophthora fragariae TaxID=53985 RepID=A0A6A3RGX6_9STRA|nr:hypothetical protein PF003_g37893 [Phytophthora fragariae]KAE8929595.1 hypothetical protein PF009_g20289 [Phytophthora fragariae]KAE8985633.1 hypothetical protein PF011_g20312 [Phytophthora fragariae]KAE9075712.1 hypothetical protein PF010_g24197 [Phytophthora fragariae]KAE9080479.1 hypothetical protein PF007_g23039 [Phytophthora fragariae]